MKKVIGVQTITKDKVFNIERGYWYWCMDIEETKMVVEMYQDMGVEVALIKEFSVDDNDVMREERELSIDELNK